MTTKLALYNGALVEYLGERRLKSLTEEREPRRTLDQVFDTGAVKYCLSMGLWNFASRTARFDPDAAIEPDFGYKNAFEKPSDWVRTSALAWDEYFYTPLNQYKDERGFWWSDTDPLYVKYVSNDELYGENLGAWPENFTEYVKCYLAFKSVKRTTENKSRKDDLEKECAKLLRNARATDGMDDPARDRPQGSWVRARTRGRFDPRIILEDT